MNKLQKLLSTLLVSATLLTASCSAIGYRAVTFQPCFPEDKEEISERRIKFLKENLDNFSLSSYGHEQELILKPNKDYIQANYEFMEF
jgi:hypothetical protein